jgi:hypothetical protein
LATENEELEELDVTPDEDETPAGDEGADKDSDRDDDRGSSSKSDRASRGTANRWGAVRDSMGDTLRKGIKGDATDHTVDDDDDLDDGDDEPEDEDLEDGEDSPRGRGTGADADDDEDGDEPKGDKPKKGAEAEGDDDDDDSPRYEVVDKESGDAFKLDLPKGAVIRFAGDGKTIEATSFDDVIQLAQKGAAFDRVSSKAGQDIRGLKSTVQEYEQAQEADTDLLLKLVFGEIDEDGLEKLQKELEPYRDPKAREGMKALVEKEQNKKTETQRAEESAADAAREFWSATRSRIDTDLPRFEYLDAEDATRHRVALLRDVHRRSRSTDARVREAGHETGALERGCSRRGRSGRSEGPDRKDAPQSDARSERQVPEAGRQRPRRESRVARQAGSGAAQQARRRKTATARSGAIVAGLLVAFGLLHPAALFGLPFIGRHRSSRPGDVGRAGSHRHVQGSLPGRARRHSRRDAAHRAARQDDEGRGRADTLTFNVKLQTGGAVANVGDGQKLPRPSRVSGRKGKTGLAHTYTVIAVGGQSIPLTKKTRNAFVSNLEEQLEDGMERVKFDLERQYNGDGRGILCLVETIGGAPTYGANRRTATRTRRPCPGTQLLVEDMDVAVINPGTGARARPIEDQLDRLHRRHRHAGRRVAGAAIGDFVVLCNDNARRPGLDGRVDQLPERIERNRRGHRIGTFENIDGTISVAGRRSTSTWPARIRGEGRSRLSTRASRASGPEAELYYTTRGIVIGYPGFAFREAPVPPASRSSSKAGTRA